MIGRIVDMLPPANKSAPSRYTMSMVNDRGFGAAKKKETRSLGFKDRVEEGSTVWQLHVPDRAFPLA
jgi:hypothetical protein